jgi:phage-related minor tail protein
MLILLQQGGQMKDMFGGIGPMFRGLGAMITPMVVGLTALAAVAGGLIYTWQLGREESQAFSAALRTSGGALGLTESQYRSMAQAASDSRGVTIGAARDAAQAAIGLAGLGPKSIGPATDAIAAYAKATGTTAAEAAKNFEGIGKDATAWALKQNESLHFLTVRTYEHIKALQDHGQNAQAAAVGLRAMTDKLEEQPEKLNNIGKALLAVKNLWSSAIDAFKSTGRTETTQDKLDSTQKAIAAMESKKSAGGMFWSPQQDLELANLKSMEATLRDNRAHEARTTALRAEVAATNDAGIAAAQFFSNMHKGQKNVENLNKALAEYDRNLEALRKSGGTMPSASQQTADRKGIHEKFTEKSAASSAATIQSAFDRKMADLDKEAITLRVQTEQWQQLGMTVDNTRVALLNVDLKTGTLGKLTDGNKAKLFAKAASNDAQAADLAAQKAMAEIDKKVMDLMNRAGARAISAREEFVQKEIEKLPLKDIEKGSQQYTDAIDRVRAAAGKLYDTEKLAPAMTEFAKSTDDRIAKITTEGDALDRMARLRLIAAESLRIEADARKMLDAFPEQSSRIKADADKQKAAIAQAIQDRGAVTSSEGFGASKALQQFADDAENQSKRASDAVAKGFKAAEDSIVSWAKTGKLSVGSFFASMAEDYLRAASRTAMASLFTNSKGEGASIGQGWSNIAGMASKVVGFFGGGGIPLATGTNYVPYDGFPATLHKGEAVVPAAYNPANGGAGSGGGGFTDNSTNTYQIGAGVSRGEVQAAIAQANARQEERMKKLSRQGAMA